MTDRPKLDASDEPRCGGRPRSGFCCQEILFSASPLLDDVPLHGYRPRRGLRYHQADVQQWLAAIRRDESGR